MEQRSIGSRLFKGTLVIVAISVLSKLASFISEAVLAAHLGTTYQSDAYYMISGINAVVYPMMSVGIWKVFLPLYKSHYAKGEHLAAATLTNKALSFFTTISIAVVVLLYVFAQTVVSVVAPGFKGETRDLCIRLVRISSPMNVFIIAAAVYASVLQCHNKFLGSHIRVVASHIPTIVAAIIFYRSFGIDAMAIALVVASVFRLLIELPFVNWGYRYRPDFNFRSSEFTLLLKRMPSALISAGVSQLNALIDKAMASMLPSGTISGLNYGQKLVNVFSGLLSSAIATALYPQMIELIALERKQELSRLLEKIVCIFMVLMFPITFACVLFRLELVSAVFQRGAFGSDSTALTSGVFALYCLALFSDACNTVISNVFYGHGNTKTPMLISVAGLAVNVGLNLALMHFMGVNGLALATSLTSILFFFVRMIAAEKYVSLAKRKLFVTALKVIFASLVACLIPRLVFWFFPINKYLVLLSSAMIGVLAYMVMIRVLHVSEINELLALLKRKMKKV